MTKEIKVDQRLHSEVSVKCKQCDEQLLLFVHKNYQEQTCILGCGFCGHKNEIKLGEVE